MLTFLIFILVIGVLVLVHEAGHFFVAKWAGMKVEEFGFGFPPRLWGWKKGETTYSINWIPFGGFVKILGESHEAANDPRSFSSKPASKRMAVIVAGVLMNVLLAYVLLVPVSLIGSRVLLDEKHLDPEARNLQINILQVAPNSPAAEIGWQPGDRFIAVRVENAITPITSVQQLQTIINSNLGKNIFVTLERAGKTMTVPVVPRLNPPAGEGPLGIQLGLTGEIKYSWQEAPIEAAKATYWITTQTGLAFYGLIKQLVLNQELAGELSGPIAIAQYTGQAARLGLVRLLEFMALISVNLAILNILPFPALDGGRLLLIIIEKLKGSPVSPKVENSLNAIGFVLLILLMIYVTTKDVIKIFNF